MGVVVLFPSKRLLLELKPSLRLKGENDLRQRVLDEIFRF